MSVSLSSCMPVVMLSSLFVGACAKAQPAGPGAPLPGAQPTTLPGGEAPPPAQADPALDAVLDALHHRGDDLKDFTAAVSLAETDDLSGDTSTLNGSVLYQLKSPGDARIHVVFESKTVGNRTDKSYRREFLLDNGLLVERDYKLKTQTTRQILKPGQKMNPLKLGEGPFPLPIGQPKEDVVKIFDAKVLPSVPADPAGTSHLLLKPRKGSQFEKRFASIDVFVDGKTNFPRRIDAVEKGSGTSKSTDLRDLKVNPGLKDADFTLQKVEGWKEINESLSE